MPSPTSTPVLVVLTGPVGGGKSTTARAITARFQAHGVGAATIDLDQIYGMARRHAGFSDEAVWKIASRGAAALSDVFFDTIADVVIVEGGFHHREDVLGLTDYITTPIHVEIVAMQVSFERALERVTADPEPQRVASRNPDILRNLHQEFVAALPYLRMHGLVIDADLHSVDGLAAHIEAHIARRRISHRGACAATVVSDGVGVNAHSHPLD